MAECVICHRPESEHGGVGGYAYVVTVDGMEETPLNVCSPECLRELAKKHAEHEADFAARVLGDKEPSNLVLLPRPEDAEPEPRD
jgi:hypothetical protein